MSSAAARIETDPVAVPWPKVIPEPDARALGLLALLAHVVVFPLGRVHDSYCDAPPLSGAALRALARRPAFHRPIHRVVARNAGFDSLDVDSGFSQRLGTVPQTRLCVLLVAAAAEELRRAAALLAAAIAHRRIAATLARADRDRLRAALDEDAFALAIREAALQYPALAQLSDAAEIDRAADLRQSPQALQDGLHALGYRAVERFVAFCEPGLSPLLERRLHPRGAAIAPESNRFTQAHVGPFTRLVRRRFVQWEAFIG